MSKKTIVCCHSPSLAFLLYETSCASNNQIGLLLGSVRDERIKSTTDENEANEEETTKIYVEHCIPFPKKIQFNAYGEFDEKVMAKFCDTLKEEIIGWYSFRRNSKSNSCSLRENLIHQRLLRYFKLMPENFIVGLIASNIHECLSTHGFNFKFLRHLKNTYEGLKFKIYCLSDKTNGYITNSSFPVSEDLKQIQSSLADQSAISAIKEIHRLSMEQLSVLNLNLQALENNRNVLEAEVIRLRSALIKNDVLNVKINPSTRKEEFNDSFLYFDPNHQYNTNGEENPIKQSIYDEIKSDVPENPDEDADMSVAPETSAKQETSTLVSRKTNTHEKPVHNKNSSTSVWVNMQSQSGITREDSRKSPDESK